MATLFEQITADYGRGLSQRELARKYGLSKGSVYYYLHGRRDRAEPPPNPDPIVGKASATDAEKERMMRRLGGGKPKLGETYIDDDDNIRRHEGKRAKLTQLQVHEIRLRYGEPGVTQAKLAKEYGVTVLAIGNILRGKTWNND